MLVHRTCAPSMIPFLGTISSWHFRARAMWSRHRHILAKPWDWLHICSSQPSMVGCWCLCINGSDTFELDRFSPSGVKCYPGEFRWVGASTKAFKLGEFQDSFELANKALEAWESWDYHADHTLNSSFLDVRCASKTCFVIFVLEYRDVKGDEEGNAAQIWSYDFLFVSICTIFILIMSTGTTHFPSFLGLGFAARPIRSTLRVRSWSNNSNHISHHCSDSWADLHISDAAALPESTTEKARMEQNCPGEFLELETSLFEVEVEALANKHHILPIGSYHMILSATSCLLRRCETHIEVIMETARWYGHLWVAHVWVCIVNVDFQQKHEGRMIHGMRLA